MSSVEERSSPVAAEDAREHPVVSALSGCLYAAFVIAVSGVLLLVNALFCLAFYAAMPKGDSEGISQRLWQMFFFLVPLLLLFVEWNLLDRLQRLFQSDDAGSHKSVR